MAMHYPLQASHSKVGKTNRDVGGANGSARCDHRSASNHALGAPRQGQLPLADAKVSNG